MGDENLTPTGLPKNCGAFAGPPAFEPERWDANITEFNNCYNYAVNIVTGRHSYPGCWKGDDGHKWLDKPTREVMTCE